MLNGVYRNSTVIHFGKNAEANIPSELPASATNMLLIHGNAPEATGLLSSIIIPLLMTSGRSFTPLGKIPSNPPLSLVRHGISVCRANSIDCILAVGGGSVIDTAKAISIGAPYAGDVSDFFTGKATPKERLLLGTVTTLPGSGSESSDACVITDDKTGRKLDCSNPLLQPSFSILNPEFSMTAPLHHRINGIFDAISHVFERYFTNTTAVECSDRLCEGLLGSLFELAPLVKNAPDNYDYNANVTWACKLAHDNTVGFGRKQDWACHKISHEIAAYCHAPHGAIMAVIFPAWMRHVARTNPDKFVQLAQRVFQVRPVPDNPLATANIAIECVSSFIIGMGLPSTLQDVGFTEKERIRQIAANCVSAMPSRTIGNFQRLSQDDIVDILNASFP